MTAAHFEFELKIFGIMRLFKNVINYRIPHFVATLSIFIYLQIPLSNLTFFLNCKTPSVTMVTHRKLFQKVLFESRTMEKMIVIT